MEGFLPALRPGAAIALRARLVPPPPMALPAPMISPASPWFQQIGATGRTLGPPAILAQTGETGFAARLADGRQRLSAHIRSRLEAGPGAIASAFATGDQGAVPEEDAEAMRRSASPTSFPSAASTSPPWSARRCC